MSEQDYRAAHPSGLKFMARVLYQADIMEKIKNGDPVFYKNLKGTIYGKPRENKYKGLLYTVKIGDDYVKATASELTLNVEREEVAPKQFDIFAQSDKR